MAWSYNNQLRYAVETITGERDWGWYPDTNTLVVGDGGVWIEDPVARDLLAWAAARQFRDRLEESGA